MLRLYYEVIIIVQLNSCYVEFNDGKTVKNSTTNFHSKGLIKIYNWGLNLK
jgi:hypothetical protein